jgi:hypothetical protein
LFHPFVERASVIREGDAYRPFISVSLGIIIPGEVVTTGRGFARFGLGKVNMRSAQNRGFNDTSPNLFGK